MLKGLVLLSILFLFRLNLIISWLETPNFVSCLSKNVNYPHRSIVSRLQDPNAQLMQTFLLVDTMICHSVDVPDQCSFSTLFSSQVKGEFTIVVEMRGAGNERGGGVSDGDDWMSISLSNKDEKVTDYNVCCKSLLTFLFLSLSLSHTHAHRTYGIITKCQLHVVRQDLSSH